MTKETFERAKELDENIHNIKELLKVFEDAGITVVSRMTGNNFRLCTLDSITHDILIENIKDFLNVRIDEMTNELEELQEGYNG